jgi:type IV pilus assembly protein PilY1
MDAGRLKGSNNFWMYMGTGDYERLTAKEASPTDPEFDNLLIGIRDKDFPYYKNVATVQLADNLDDCSDTTTDDTGILCPSSSQRGWVIHLSNAEKVTAEPTLNKGRVLFPIFQPTQSVNTCTTGKALICNVDAKCGTPKNTEIGSANDLDCLEVGTGVLSKIVVFGNKLFANIAGEANVGSSQPGKTDLVSINAASTIIESFRNSWRENF